MNNFRAFNEGYSMDVDLETVLQKENASVKDAWEKYQIVLKLASAPYAAQEAARLEEERARQRSRQDLMMQIVGN